MKWRKLASCGKNPSTASPKFTPKYSSIGQWPGLQTYAKRLMKCRTHPYPLLSMRGRLFERKG
eukprot:scaffold135040_cov15-Tisochrysis_lutea.AAC.1